MESSINSGFNLHRMSKPPGNFLDFFLSKQTRVENDLSSENELDESLIITENNSLSLDLSNEDLSLLLIQIIWISDNL